MVTVVATWSGSYARNPAGLTADFAPLAPTALAVSNAAGNWLLAFASWRQDAGVAGTLQYPSTVSVCDDAHNFWIPLQSGVPATAASASPETGIVRCAVWMAPAARAAEYVFFSPTAYQSALTVVVTEVTAECPWYEVQSVTAGFANRATSFSLSLDPGTSGLIAFGAIGYDSSASVTVTSTGWAQIANPAVTNGVNDDGDMYGYCWYNTNTGSAMTFSASTSTTMDFAGVMVTVEGIQNAIAFPYAQPLENWPVLITEIASGPLLNSNPLMLNGTSDWTGTGATVAAATWPSFQPYPNYQSLIPPSVSVTPTGSSGAAKVASGDTYAVSPAVQYNALAWVYSEAGFSPVTVAIDWFTSGFSYISSATAQFSVSGAEWTQLTLPAPVYPPPTAAFADVSVDETVASGDVPASAVFWLGYCALTVADAYEGAPPDEISWTDFSSRNFTETSIQVERGIQFEQQSLEAGTMTVTLANNDFELMFGNVESLYWPNMGDTDVPIRLRAIWPGSVTPYYVLFSGYTDDIDFGFNPDTRYAYASFTCSDAWSRLTQQMLGGAEMDVLGDSPEGYWVCSISGANSANGGITTVQAYEAALGTQDATVTFASSAIALPGDQGANCWQVTLPSSSPGVNEGYSLGYFPAGGGQALPPVADGVTVEFWMSPAGVASANQPVDYLFIVTCWSGSGIVWYIAIDNTSGPSSSMASINVVDKVTNSVTTTTLGSSIFLGTDSSTETWYFAVTFNQTSMTVNFAGTTGEWTSTTVSCNLSATISGFGWAGGAGPYGVESLLNLGGFATMAVYGIAVYDYLLPAARQASHWYAGEPAYASELDTDRLARIAGYSGFVPVLGMRCTDLGSVFEARDLDIVTLAADCSGQVISDYFTNIAQSTLAFMFMDGPGALIYRRRLEACDRALAPAAVGEDNLVPLNSNTLSQSASTSPWSAEDNATLTSSSLPATISALFDPFCGLFTGNGSTANPQIAYGRFGVFNGVPVTPGLWYTLSCWMYSPQGFGNNSSTGVQIQLQWINSGGSVISSADSPLVTAPADGLMYLEVPAAQAPSAAVDAWLIIGAVGTPASTVEFYVAQVVFGLVNTVTSGGPGLAAAEAPYLVDVKLSSDRAQLFNEAILTQYGTDEKVTNSGTDLEFTPTSGVTVTITNDKSAAQRGSVPYTATLYTNNTAQAVPYYLGEPSVEDFGNWIVQTLGSPLFRPLTVTITPVATAEVMTRALKTEIGDTMTFRRRHLGAPEVQILTYCSKLTHDIDIASGQWQTKYELSPFPYGTVLQCDNVFQGTLTGGNYLGF